MNEGPEYYLLLQESDILNGMEAPRLPVLP